MFRLHRGLVCMIVIAILCVGGIGYWAWSWQGRETGMNHGHTGSDQGAVGALDGMDQASALYDDDDETVYALYAGSESCRECHTQAYEDWAHSHHGLAERTWDHALDHAAFHPDQTVRHGTQTTRVAWENHQAIVTTAGPGGGDSERFEVQRVIGHNPLRQYLLETEPGRLQALELAHDPHQGDWFNIFGDEDRVPGDWGHWTGRGMNWNSMCAACHNTRLRKNYDPAKDVYRTRAAEMGVSCESCHGPMQRHVDWQKAQGDPLSGGGEGIDGNTEPDPTLTKLDPLRMLDTCGSCHSRRQELTGDFVPGTLYEDHHALVLVDGTDTYYADGQVRDENYEFGSFLSSRMHAAGVHCQDCHHPHTAKRLTPDNQLCQQCHSGARVGAPVIIPGAHTFHAAGSSGAQCTSCHMPQTTYMERHDRHDHGFTIPDPKLTLDFGIPNACNRCHVEQDAHWALDHVEKWYGKRRDRTARDRVRERVQWIEKVRRGERMEGEELLRQLDSETQPFWQASITQLLGAYTAEIGVRARLTAQLTHTNAMVRAQSIHGLAPWLESEGTTLAARTRSGGELRRAVEARLTDPVRQVRLQAAWALRSELDLDSVAGRDLMHLLRLHADQPTGQLQLGNFHWDRKDPELALQHFSKAIDWDPNSAVIRHEHAILLSLTGNQDAARRELENAVALAPGEAEYRYKLGLAWNETGDVRRARSELLEAVQLDPQHARAWYNLGLAESSMELLESALDRLIRAETVDPIDPRAPYARATIHARLGQFREAREAVSESLRRHPGYGPAEGLLRQLPR